MIFRILCVIVLCVACVSADEKENIYDKISTILEAAGQEAASYKKFSGKWILLESPQKNEPCKEIQILEKTKCVVVYEKEHYNVFMADTIEFIPFFSFGFGFYHYSDFINDRSIVLTNLGDKIEITKRYHILSTNFKTSYILEPIAGTPFVYFYGSWNYYGDYKDTGKYEKNIFVKTDDIDRLQIPRYKLTEADLKDYKNPYFSSIPLEYGVSFKARDNIPKIPPLPPLLQDSSNLLVSFFTHYNELSKKDFRMLFLHLISQTQSYFAILTFVFFSIIALSVLTKFIWNLGNNERKSFFTRQSEIRFKIAWLSLVFMSVLVLMFLVVFGILMLFFVATKPEFKDSMSYLGSIDILRDGIDFLPIWALSEPYTSTFYGTYNWLNYYTSFEVSAYFAIAIVLVTLIASFFKKGVKIDSIAKDLDARELKEKLNVKERTLVNVVEEMAIASQMKMPRVFVLKDENFINALCVGEKLGKIDERYAIFVTNGVLEKLSRDELQAIVAHEFSHIAHNDIKQNLYTLSIIFGLWFVSMIGLWVIVSTSKSRSDNKGGAAIFGVFILIIGSIGMFFAKIIQAAISRQREFLADTSSLQYTRTDSIISVLEKIASEQENSLNATDSTRNFITNPKSNYYAHMFLSDISKHYFGFFATHPPLKKRIEAIKKLV